MASKACCELAPVSANYENKGRWETVAGVKTYVVGNENADRAILDIYDVFGASSQTIQGADRLAALTSALVFVPDLFEGNPLDRSLIPPDTEEKQQKVQAFITGPANVEKNMSRVLQIREEIGSKWPSVEEHVGIFGLCWGGKIAILACGEDNKGQGRHFTVSGTAHPGGLDAKDAENTNAPHILLASPGEPEDIVAQCKEILSQPGKVGEVETYSTMFHGWMGARANLEDAANLTEYERGYKQAADFFSKYL
ncbi:dienelactone hydrolase family protein [Mariannaea sp. PMI_226]|nr:dienelactone hydrolase family protein [Mariannaea sp. PMI_226]